MISIRCLFAFACLFALSTAFEVEEITKLDIVKNVEFEETMIRAKDVSLSSNSSEVIKTFQTSQGRVTSLEITCRGICTNAMSYDLVVNGISSKYLETKDRGFRSLLTDTQKTSYDNAKKGFKGGLGVTFLRAVGINLGGRYSRGKVNEAREGLRNYEELSNEARRTMGSFENVTARLSGSMTVKSYTAMLSEAVALVKFAKVTLTSGRELRVFSASKADVKVIDKATGVELDVSDLEADAVQKSDGSVTFSDEKNPIL